MVFLEKGNVMSTLNYTNKKLTTFPSINIQQQTTCANLQLTNNKLTSIPASIANFSNLLVLDLEANQLKKLPVEVNNLVELISLNLKHNQFTTFPSIFSLKNLTVLDLANNKLKSLPKEIQQLENLQYLNLKGNPLPLPENISPNQPKELIEYVLKYQNRKTSPDFKIHKAYIFQNFSLLSLVEEYKSTLDKTFKEWGIKYIDLKSSSQIDKHTTIVFIIVTWDVFTKKGILKRIIDKCIKLNKPFYILFQPEKYVTLDKANKAKMNEVLKDHDFIFEHYKDKIVEYKDLEALTVIVKQRVQQHTPKIILKHLSLKNVGHFDELTVPLDEKLCCLVGENGAGKTTILRSIALALTGPKHDKINQEAINRMLKVYGLDNKNEATIAKDGHIKLTYSLDGDEFVNTIHFKVDDNSRSLVVTIDAPSEVLSINSTLKSLIIGFAQSRTEANGKAYAPIKYTQAHVNDLIPLINNHDSGRLTSFVDWLVNLDNAAKNKEVRQANSKTKKQVPERILITKAFDIISRVANMSEPMVFKKITQVQPPIVWVTTFDAPKGIRMDMLSQGFKAIIGWTGHFIQRMQETYPYSADFTQEPAIVLVDEIDAFFHPKWQLKVLQELRNIFPNVQFIVGSHSPLSTFELDRGQVIKLAKNEKGKIEAKANEIDYWAWQYDDLMSKVFDNPYYLEATYNRFELEEKVRQLQSEGKDTSKQEEILARLKASKEEAGMSEHDKIRELQELLKERDQEIEELIQGLENEE